MKARRIKIEIETDQGDVIREVYSDVDYFSVTQTAILTESKPVEGWKVVRPTGKEGVTIVFNARRSQ